MILRTFTCLDQGVVFGLALVLSVIDLPLLVSALGPNVAGHNCSSSHCLITSETRDNGTPRWPRPAVSVREAKLDDIDSRPAGLGLSHGLGLPTDDGLSSINASLKHAEEEIKDKQKPVIQVEPKSSRPTPTDVLPQHIGADNKTGLGLGLKQLNASADEIHDTYFAKSLPYKFNTAALLRGFYVFGGLGAMVVMYIMVRTIRLRRKITVRRYGILANREDVEMTPLGVDDDEDMTLFER